MTKPAPLQPELFSALLDLIYDCVLEHKGWPRALQRIADYGPCKAVMLAARPSRSARFTRIAEAGNPSAIKIAELRDLNDKTGIFPIAEHQPDHDIQLACHIGPQSLLVALAARDRQSEAMEFLQIVLPHLTRCLAMSDLLEAQRHKAEQLDLLFDGVETAMLLVDNRQHVEHLNLAARGLLARGDLLRTENGILIPADVAHEAPLARLIILAARDGRSGILAMRRPDRQPAVLHALPINKIGRRNLAALTLVQARVPDALTLNTLAQLAGLTGKEAEVFHHLALGQSVDAAAAAMGLARSTVRSHVLRVYEKTGCSRQPELVAMAHAVISS